MSTQRDEFSESVIRILRERVGSFCSNPDCSMPTTGPNANPDKASRIGVAAHITAAAPGGARYDVTLSTEQRESISNGIWLCQNCGRLVDVDPLTYPTSLLNQWKSSAEEAARKAIQGIRTNPAFESNDKYSEIRRHIGETITIYDLKQYFIGPVPWTVTLIDCTPFVVKYQVQASDVFKTKSLEEVIITHDDANNRFALKVKQLGQS